MSQPKNKRKIQCDCQKNLHHYIINILQKYLKEFIDKVNKQKIILEKLYKSSFNILKQNTKPDNKYYLISNNISEIDKEIETIVLLLKNLITVVQIVIQIFKTIFTNGNNVIHDELFLLTSHLKSFVIDLDLDNICKNRYKLISFSTDFSLFIGKNQEEYQTLLFKFNELVFYINSTVTYYKLKCIYSDMDLPYLGDIGCLKFDVNPTCGYNSEFELCICDGGKKFISNKT
jgi:hypothetical protein